MADDAVRGNLPSAEQQLGAHERTAIVKADKADGQEALELPSTPPRIEMTTLPVDETDLIEAERRYYAAMIQGGAYQRQKSAFPEIEHALLRALAPHIPERTAVDVGAYRGSYTEMFAALGLDVTTFEPVPSLALALRQRWTENDHVKIIMSAVGDQDGVVDFGLAEMNSALADTVDRNLFNSLVSHSSAGILDFPHAIRTPIRRIRTLVEQGLLPRDIGILKVDTEGQDRAVLAGAWPYLGRVTLCEFWNKTYPFSDESTPNDVGDYHDFVRARAAYRMLVLGRDEANGRMFFQVDPQASVPGSWGNVLLTMDKAVFAAALNWCVSVFGTDGLEI